MAAPEKMWEDLIAFYDKYRTAKLNELYYAARLKSSRKRTNAVQICTLAFGLISIICLSARDHLGPWPFWGAYGLVMVGLALCEVVRVTSSQIRYTRLHFAYRTMCLNMSDLVVRIRTEKRITACIRELSDASQVTIRDVGNDEDLSINEDLRRRFSDEVNRDIPPASLWMPEEWHKVNEERSDADESRETDQTNA